jgi:hypothetical protein
MREDAPQREYPLREVFNGLRYEMKFAIAEILWDIRNAPLECQERVEENKTILEDMRFYPLHELINKICNTCLIFEQEIKTFNPSPGAQEF